MVDPYLSCFLPYYDQNRRRRFPRFYIGFVDDIISKKKKNQPNLLFENLNNHHPNIKYTIEIVNALTHYYYYEDNQIKIKVHKNEKKLPVH